MPDPAPFAFGYAGRWLTSTHEHEVFICDGQEDHTVHIVPLDTRVTGVRNTTRSVLALDRAGTIYGLDPSTGQRAWQHAIGREGLGLAATEHGRWAVVHAEGVAWGEGAQPLGSVPLADARHAAFDPSGEVLAIVTADGTLTLTPLAGGVPTILALGFAATGLCHSRLGYWLVSTARGVFRVPVDGREPELYLKWGGDDPPTGIVCSGNGRLCAFTTESRVVVLFGVERDLNCGAIIYADREVGELEFGPDAWLGVGIGLGDGNKIDLLRSGACRRTDPPPGRTRNRWMLQLGFDPEEIAEAYGPQGSGPAMPAPSADPRTQWGGNASTGAAPPTSGMLLYAVGILGIAGFLAYSAATGWYDDPFLAWLGAGIFGISGVSILVAGRRR